jgi:hypothetical protein
MPNRPGETSVYCAPEFPSALDAMLWQKQGDPYRLTRVVSYDHLSDRERKALNQHKTS